MRTLVHNISSSLRVVQTVFIVLGFWAPTALKSRGKIIYNFYTFFSYMFLNGTYIIIQVVYLFQVWGNVPLMTDAMFLLFTNMCLSIKIHNMYWRKKAIGALIAEMSAALSDENRPEGLIIVQRCNRETAIQLFICLTLAYATISGWVISGEKGDLFIAAWYPYDTTKSPAYELTYAHQFIALSLAATLNMCMDSLVTSLICQCQCQFKLLSISMRSLCDNLIVTKQGLISPEADALLTFRLCRYVKRHQAVLRNAAQLQTYFSIHVFGQFIVSMGIICVTAYQMAVVCDSIAMFFSMLLYMKIMLLQVFYYCYHGNKLFIESEKVAGAIYECPWYTCRPAHRRWLLLMMVRAQRETRLKAGNLTELSLATFVAIVKASYTFFTVLQRVEESPKG